MNTASGNAINGIAHMAAIAQFPVPVIRYWAEMHGPLIGAERMPDGEWNFTEVAVHFFELLATERMTAAAEETSSQPAPKAPKVERESEATGPNSSSEASTLKPDPEPDTATVYPDAIAAQLNALTSRTEHLSLHIEDLAEETKQLQVLLTRIITLLTPMPRQGAREQTVRAWHPPRL